MTGLGHHLVLRLADDRVIAPSDAARRRLAREIARIARTLPVLAWKVADTHTHVLIGGDSAAATEFVRRLRIVLPHAYA
jgi:hypothetical protein